LTCLLMGDPSRASSKVYMGLAAGKVVERRTPEGEKKFELSVDPSTTRDAVGKLLPAAKQTIAIEGDGLLEQAIRRLRERKSGDNR
jgi:hypothetical protein